MVYRSNSSTHLNSTDINNVLPIPTVNHKSLSFTNLTLPPPQPTTDYDPGKHARRSVRRLSIDIERLRLKKDVTALCTSKRRNSVCRSVSDLSKSGLYDDLKSLKTQRNECVQKHRSDKNAVPCTTTSETSIPQTIDRYSDGLGNVPSWLSEGLETDPELEDKNLNRFPISVPLNRLPVKTVDLLLAMKNNQTTDKLKILCLYCDRTFSSQSLYAKHSERVHQAPEGRRLSARNSNSSSLLYPGCSHCHNGKTTSLLNEELPALFHHLIDIHFDKYFACKPCTIRFPTKEALQTHLDQLHKDAALKTSPDKRNKGIERRVPENAPTDLCQPLTIQVDLADNFDDKKDEEKSSPDEPILRSSRRQHANRLDLTKTTSPRKTRMLRNEETILSRLGITQNRFPRTRRGFKTRSEVVRAETPIIRSTRNKNTRSTNNSTGVMAEGMETRSSAIAKVESLSSTFDENFYESVSSNVRQNLSCHLDGKLQSGPMSPSPISPVDPVPAVRSTLVRSPLVSDSEIHEATAISTLTAFPTLLTASQYGAEPMPVGKIKKPITKNSWKWKWDCVKKYKYVNEGGKVVKKVKQPIAGIRDLSKLDMWTQLTMRTKHELVRKNEMEASGEEPCLAVGEAAREDKRKLITQLNKILDTRILPQITLEQNDQRVVKLEVFDTSPEAEQAEIKPEEEQPNGDLLTILQIAKKPVSASKNEDETVLSGEWARPRCYICFGCGEKFETMRRLEDHKNTVHPHVYSTHYEIVGKELIDGDLFRHFYIPTAALRAQSKRLNVDRKSNPEVEDSMDSVTSFSISCSKSDSFDMDSSSRNSKVSAISTSTSVGNVDESSSNDLPAELKKSCTKCKRSYNTMSELYRHMLDCSGDYDWFLAKKRHNIKYRYFGSKRRKINRANFVNRRPIRPKKEESDAPRIRDIQTPKPRPSDAESIQRMLENLPAKRVCRQIFPNLQAKKRVRKFMPVNTLSRGRKQMHLKPTNTKTNRNFKFIATAQTTANAIRKNISLRLRFLSTNSNEMVRSTRSARAAAKQENDEETTDVIDKGPGVIKKITRRAQRIFPKKANSFRRPLQKRNVRNAASATTETNSASVIDRMRKSKRVQVTLKKLDEKVVDLVKLEDRKIVEERNEVENSVKKVPVRKRTIKRLIRKIRGKRTGSKKTKEKKEAQTPAETPSDAKIEEVEKKTVEEVQEIPIQVDETSQSSSRSGSSRKCKRNSIKKQKSIEATADDVLPTENIVEGPPQVEEAKTVCLSIDVSVNQHEVIATNLLPEEPIDLSQSRTKLTVPVVQEPMKTPPIKRRTRKLNDCIAMLTGKLQEKLGVPFLNNEMSILLSPNISEVTESSNVAGKEDLITGKGELLAEKEETTPEKEERTPEKEQFTAGKEESTAGTAEVIAGTEEFTVGKEGNGVESMETDTKETIPSQTMSTKYESPDDLLPNSDSYSSQPTEIEANIVVVAPTVEIVQTKEGVISEDASQIATVTPTPEVLIMSSKDTALVSKEVTDTSDNLPAEKVQPVEATLKLNAAKTKNSSLNQNAKLDKPPTKRSGKGRKAKPIDENKDKSCSLDVVALSDQSTDQASSVKSTKKKAKKKILQEATVTVDVPETPVIDNASVGSVPKKRQSKNSSLTAFDLVQEDRSSLNTSEETTEETETVFEQEAKATSKQKLAKRKGTKSASDAKNIRRSNSKSTRLPSEIEPLENVVDQQSDEKPIVEVKSDEKPIEEVKSDEKPIEEVRDIKKGRKSKKKSMERNETKLSEVVTPNQPIDKSSSKTSDFSDEEMHPWDPEIGFITANNPEPASTPAFAAVAVPDAVNETQDSSSVPSSTCNEPTNEVIPVTAKVTDEKSTTKKKRRKNELAKIIADQLLESFKVVDKSRVEELKLLHDLSIESNDDLLLSTTISRTPPPKRRTASNIRSDAVADSDTNREEVAVNENVEKVTSKRKKTTESKKSMLTFKIGKKKKNVAPKASKKDNKKKTVDVTSSASVTSTASGYLSDTEICQTKKPVILRRRLTICDESPKRMSRNSKETEVQVSLFDSFKKRKNVNEFTTKPKALKRKNKRNVLHESSKDLPTNTTNEDTGTAEEQVAVNSSPNIIEDSCKSKANVNDLVTQIINDFTTSTLNSPTTSPILFGNISKPRLTNTATKLSSVLSNKKNILNGETLTNGFKSDVSKEITFASLSQPLKDKTVEQIRNTDSSLSDAKQPFRAPFMSPRWDPSDEWNGSSKPIKDPAQHKLWTLNNKDEQLSGEKSLYHSVKEKTKKLLGKISRKKARKHEVTLNNKKSASAVAGVKRPLLRPSILSVSNHTAKVDTIETENCLKKLESNSLFLGKICNFENDSTSRIFRNDAISDKIESREMEPENELFGRKTDADAISISNLKSNLEKEDSTTWNVEKKFDDKISKNMKMNSNFEANSINKTKQNAQRKWKDVAENDEETIVVDHVDVPKEETLDKVSAGNIKRRKMGSVRRKTDNAVSVKKSSDDLNEAFCGQDDSTIKPTTSIAKPVQEIVKPFDESSQDTIISEIVNKIRDSNAEQVSESDEDLSLAEIAKNLNNKINNCDEFGNDGVEAAVELSESFVGRNNFNTLVAVLNDQLDTRNDEKTDEITNCDDADDADTNNDLVDMDLEDTASVYTSSMETTVTTCGGSQKRRKRRHGRSILMKPSRKSKRSDGDFLAPGDSFFCDLCSKTFRTQGGLATHKTTLTHISKLSEQEFKLKMETPKEAMPEPKTIAEEDVTTKPDVTQSPIIESSSQPHIPFSQSPSSTQRYSTSPARNQSLNYLNNIEPISSPEHQDLNYDRYSTIPRSRNQNNAPTQESSRMALSQEERFFYECCSMLKGFDRSTVNPIDSPNKYYTLPERNEVITKPVTPRSNEQYSYVVPEGSKHSKGIPKIDLNQFSDISSDSNPAYSCPQNPSSSETQNIFPIESKRIVEKRDYHSPERNFDLMKKDGRTFNEKTTIIDREYMETYSDMGDSFPSSQDVSESEQYTQTILERSSNSVGLIRGGYQDDCALYGKTGDGNKKERNVYTIAMESNEPKGYSNGSPVESPLHSTSSQSSTLSKPRTKAAMKGYDNFKISIPTTEIDLQQALNRSPNQSGCKLAALADIALGNDVPNVTGLMRSHSDIDVEPSHTSLKDATKKAVPEIQVPKQQAPKKSTKVDFNNRNKKKAASAKTPKKSNKTNVKVSPKSLPKSQPKDVYDFEDFDDSTDAPILTLSQVRSKPLPPVNIVEEEDSDTSSYSDRLDYNYESMSESDRSVDNLQKKCLIERIFKSVKKPDIKEKEKIEAKPKPLPKQELDKLFDGLRQNDKNAKAEDSKATEKGSLNANKQIDEKLKNERSRDRQSRKPREIANLEEEWGMSMNEIVELIGVGQRKTQRRCAANKQKTFAENWDSDEYEDFHATKDIFALIREAETKACKTRTRTARSNAKRELQQENEKAEDARGNSKAIAGATNKTDAKDKENNAMKDDKSDVTSKEPHVVEIDDKKLEPSKRSHSKSTDSKNYVKKPAKVKRSKSFVDTESDDSDEEFNRKKVAAKASKIKNRRQTISSRHYLHKPTTKSLTNGARVKPNRSDDSRDFKPQGKSKAKPIPRRKRKASEMLYYWSSSSDDEYGRVKPRDDNYDNDNLEQHGWIVGDSHKKLVTLLAHAKGKKIEDCAVKKAIHKKKS